ncbi:DUF1450 domain-containing protein [Oceanirhabdus sp. W0125-5]|uniref:DUF1450 domain-containing protein n=1 Tax=Oceanirhabdus sp. W0125-5 TaxID=2999116 RepID=UPI0022F2D00F|nr:DUF1450 domain-containing protein [Oceanirhabdus sp. W0125-5]WBW95010.1 DUF1450 domain-containing protein [Oceanirhabdus sp. W0125-5]
MSKIIFCQHNLSLGTEEVLNRIKENHKDAHVEVAPCVDECGLCGKGPFAIVDGEALTAICANDLYEKISKKI